MSEVDAHDVRESPQTGAESSIADSAKAELVPQSDSPRLRDDANNPSDWISQIADFVMACHDLVGAPRHAQARIFQVGGRRRLLHACEATTRRLNEAYSSELPDQRQKALAQMAIAISDGVFRDRGDLTAIRLAMFLAHRLGMRQLEVPKSVIESWLQDSLKSRDIVLVEQALASGFATSCSINGPEPRPGSTHEPAYLPSAPHAGPTAVGA